MQPAIDHTPHKGSRSSRWLKAGLKIAVTAVCLWYVSGKIDLHTAGKALAGAKWGWLIPALLLFIASKWVSAWRLNIYFRNIGLRLPESGNLRLYWLGMFYNLFLPGSISGDAYKVILLSRRFKTPYKLTTSAVLLDRFSGLLGLGVWLALAGWWALPSLHLNILLSAGALLAIGALWFVIQRWWKVFRPGFISTFGLGLGVQALQVLSVICIMAALRLPLKEPAYIFLFLLSSVASVLPLTVGGIGIRELVFLEGSRYFGLSNETAVLISLVFYLITLLTSAAGAFYIFRDPLTQKKDPAVAGP